MSLSLSAGAAHQGALALQRAGVLHVCHCQRCDPLHLCRCHCHWQRPPKSRHIRARHGHCRIEREALIEPSCHSKTRFFHRILYGRRMPVLSPSGVHRTGLRTPLVFTPRRVGVNV
eukprot:9402451-Pyramimonas_sp.AAC.1